MRIYLLSCLLLFSCVSTRVVSPTLVEMRAKSYEIVSLENLLKEKASFHGKYVQTEGFFNCGNEEQAIYYDIVYTYNDSTIRFREYCGLWLEFNYNDPSNCKCQDSVNKKFVTVRGYFDTTKKGHVGGCYRASLINAFDMSINKNVPGDSL